jgi:hypothetical protein
LRGQNRQSTQKCGALDPASLYALLLNTEDGDATLLRKVGKRLLEYDVRSEVSTAVTMKNAVIWDIKTQSVLQRR